MQSMKLEWKEFSVDLEAVDAKFRVDYPGNYCGNQAATSLELYFEGELTEQMKADVQAFWDGLSGASAEVTSYRSASAVSQAVADAKAALPTKTWDAMSTVERKLAMGQSATKAELIAAELL